MLKLSLPDTANFYKPLVDHPKRHARGRAVRRL